MAKVYVADITFEKEFARLTYGHSTREGFCHVCGLERPGMSADDFLRWARAHLCGGGEEKRDG